MHEVDALTQFQKEREPLLMMWKFDETWLVVAEESV